MNEINPKDYVVANHGGKPHLIRVLRIVGDKLFGVHEYKDQEDKIEVDLKSVRANLGVRPAIGRVYGANTERLIDVSDHEPFHTVEWFFDAPASEQKLITDGVDKGIKMLTKNDVHHILDVCKLRVVVNPKEEPTGKTILGTYQGKSGTADNPDIITYRHHTLALKVLPYLLAHEAAHGIWYRLLPSELKAKWVAAFYGQSTIEWYSQEQVAETVVAMVKQGSTKPEGEDYYSEIAPWILGGVKGTCGLRSKDVHLLLTHDLALAKRVLGDWRKWSIPTGSWETHVTDYANTSVEELFSEAFALRMTGKGLPDYLEELWEEILEEIKGKKPVIYESEE